MKTTTTATLAAAVFTLCALALAGGAAWAQATPEAGRGAEVEGRGAQQGQPAPERAVPPAAGRAEQAPSEDGPAAQEEEEPPVQGCQDRGRKLELIV